MNREIKFRYWDPFNQQMWPMDSHLAGFFAVYERVFRGENNPVLMQFTGAEDKNGVEVYEGDVIQTTLPKPYPIKLAGEVKFVERGFWIEIDGSLFWPREFAVIGNIYENPEILAPEKQKVIGDSDSHKSESSSDIFQSP